MTSGSGYLLTEPTYKEENRKRDGGDPGGQPGIPAHAVFVDREENGEGTPVLFSECNRTSVRKKPTAFGRNESTKPQNPWGGVRSVRDSRRGGVSQAAHTERSGERKLGEEPGPGARPDP